MADSLTLADLMDAPSAPPRDSVSLAQLYATAATPQRAPSISDLLKPVPGNVFPTSAPPDADEAALRAYLAERDREDAAHRSMTHFGPDPRYEEGRRLVRSIDAFFKGGPAPMEPTLMEMQAGARIVPGQTRRPNVLPITWDAQTGQAQLAMPRMLDLFGSVLPSPAKFASVPALARTGETVLGASQEAKLLAAKRQNIYNPPAKEPRPFTDDYRPEKWPDGPPVDESGRLTHDTEGRPLGARWVVGRNVVGGADQAFPASELNALTEAGTGKNAQVVAPSKIRGAAGAVEVTPAGDPKHLFLSNRLHPDDVALIHAHENAHVIDLLAGKISAEGLQDELKAIYNTLNNPNRARTGGDAASWGKPWTPQAAGYKGADVEREMMVEAIRAYMADPNYLKTVAPGTAARIRETVNADPRLKGIIQFNAIVPPGAAVGAGNMLQPGGPPPAEPAGKPPPDRWWLLPNYV